MSADGDSMSGSAPTQAVPTWGGAMRLRPGAPVGTPTIISTRPDLAPRLAAGRMAEQVPDLLGALFTMCAQAHRWTARLAIRAAAGASVAVAADEATALQLATLREQILRVQHDWPRLLPGVSPAALAAEWGAERWRDCPVWRAEQAPEAQLLAMPDWLSARWLGMPVVDWLAAFALDPHQWPADWARRGATPLARMLAAQCPLTRELRTVDPVATPAIHLNAAMPELAHDMAARPDFCVRPSWRGAVPDTGPWRRQASGMGVTGCAGRSGGSGADGLSVWDRLVARIVEVLHLSQPGGDGWLQHGALSLSPGEGIAWTEMARGLLVHRVVLMPASGHHTGAGDRRVATWHVLAPTEWNFHPDGVLAAALRTLAPDDHGAAARLAVAFDPCVAFEMEGAPAHA